MSEAANLSGLWKPHTEKPTTIPTTALIVVRDETGELHLLGNIYNMSVHTDGEWMDEDTNAPIGFSEYWWLEESLLLATVPAPLNLCPDCKQESCAPACPSRLPVEDQAES